ncbi:unnamed protein product [Heterobilharzia americana]|nr:unnamed protein product [Heterobilharzia americana]
MNGLLRPGVCEVWRRRREDRSKQLSRNLMGRLRPNPRPRRYSDMISQSNHHCHVDGLLSLDSIHNSDKILHQSTRPSTVSAARLTAAKKLIRAKSHVQGSVQIAPIRSHNSGFVDELCQRSSHLDPRKSRAGHRSSKISISMSSQNSRHPDVSHHIDWKFCYVSSNKQNEVPSISNNIQRRRRQTNFTAKGRIESIDDVSSTRSPDSSPHRLEGDNSKECDDFRTQELTNYSHPKSDNAIHLRTCSNDGVDMLGVKYDASVKLMNVRRLERRRKRRRAITFQRKRPSERFLTSRKEGKRYSCKTYSRDDSPASSSTSNSGIVDAYGRSFRQARWYHRPAKDIPSDQTESSYRFHNCLEFRPRKLERSLSSPRIRAGSKLGNRRVGLSEASHVHGSRHRIPRRPDKMCQLTLLDRLVLGLNCSVSQNDDEIHIKQLHAEELNILTQRMSRTGFFIQSLALRQNANNDAEYNIVLTFSSENDASTRRTRRSNSLLRSKLDSHEKPLSYRSSTGNQNCSRRISCLASRHACSSRPHYSSRCHHFRDLNDSPLFDGYQSDSGLFMHPASSCIRDCHSDSEGLRLHRHNYFRKLSINRKVKPHVLRSSEKISHTYSALESFDKVRLRHSQSCSSSGPTKMETPRSCMQLKVFMQLVAQRHTNAQQSRIALDQ